LKSKLKKFFSEVIILLAMIMIASVAVNLYKTWNVKGGTAPALTFTTINNIPVMTQPEDQPMLVHFWATWCPVCSLEQASIESISQDYPVITIAMQSGNADELLPFMQKEDLSFPVIADEDGRISKQWSVTGVPASFVISPEGEIAFVEVGYTSEIGLRARLWWAGK
jgi:peroxiredoxin